MFFGFFYWCFFWDCFVIFGGCYGEWCWCLWGGVFVFGVVVWYSVCRVIIGCGVSFLDGLWC